jgi:outer membrane protein assembly factor BamB
MKVSLIMKKAFAMGGFTMLLILNIFSSSAGEKLTKSFDSIMDNQSFVENNSLKDTVKEGTNGNQWGLYGHDAQNTCHSEFPASSNPGHEKWKFFVDAPLYLSTPVIDGDGVIYITSSNHGLFAVYPNGTLKWHRDLIGFQEYPPALGPDGTIYAGTMERFHAFFPNGTLRWILPIKKDFTSKPVINSDGTIYVGTSDGYVFAIYPDGIIKWEFYLGYLIDTVSIDNNGNIYIAAYPCDYLYSLYSNGTFRWRFWLNQVITDAPLIGPDGTLYIVPIYDVVAIAPNGTEKWRVNLGGSAGTPALASDGTIIYSPYSKSYIYKLNPSNGNILWQYQIEITSRHKTRPAIANDGTIFFAYTDSTENEAFVTSLNPDGTLKWTTRLTSDICPFDYVIIGANPSISADGTLYITSWFGTSYSDFGYIHAFRDCDPNAPEKPTVAGVTRGKTGFSCEFMFRASSPLGNDVYYLVDWGDSNGETEIWFGPCRSNETVISNHTWSVQGVYEIRVIAQDNSSLQGPWSDSLKVTVASKTLLVGFVCNLSMDGEYFQVFNSKAVLVIQSSPLCVKFYHDYEKILVFNEEYHGFLKNRLIFGVFYATQLLTKPA